LSHGVDQMNGEIWLSTLNIVFSVTNTNCLVKEFQALKTYNVAKTITYLSDVSSKFQSSMTTFHYRHVRMHNTSDVVSIIEMDLIRVSIMHDNMCILIHEKCH
jgi:hypothetical protein